MVDEISHCLSRNSLYHLNETSNVTIRLVVLSHLENVFDQVQRSLQCD